MNQCTNEIIFLEDSESSLLNVAFDAVSGYENLVPKRLKSFEIIQRFTSKPSKRLCFVLSRFEGECYDHLRLIEASIYGPQVILHYVRENKSLPNLTHPLFSNALINAIVTVTSITGPQREYILDSVQMLHGKASRDLTDDVNVIITTKVGSKKYIVGASRNLHILLPDWINEAWKLSSIQDPIDMLLPVYLERFTVPIFSQLVICVSGLSIDERKEVSDLVVKHGGRYSGAMKIGETTHLIIKNASGIKYSHAKKWKIQIVNIRWLVDSVNKGYALDEEEFRVHEFEESSSTPTSKENKCSMSFSNISAISHVNSTTGVDETRSEVSLVCNQDNVFRALLANCVIMLCSCTKEETILYSSIVKKLGGKLCTELYDQVSETLTHVVVGNNSFDANLKTLESDMFYVYGSWLSSCERLGKYLPESEYLIPNPIKDCDADQDTLAEDVATPVVDDADLQLINQYFGTDGFAEVDEFDQNKTINGPIMLQTKSTAQENKNIIQNVSKNDDPAYAEGVFSGIMFSLHDELSENDALSVSESINLAGGYISQLSNKTQFLITPFFVKELPNVVHSVEFVTTAWIFHCLFKKDLCKEDLQNEPAFKPVIKASNHLSLSECVISLSGFVGRDRTLLTSYAQAMGAIVQECFLRKAVPSRNLAASTHLIASKPDGRKWPAAKQWGLPAVNREWLYACANSWSVVRECDFQVHSSIESTLAFVKEHEFQPKVFEKFNSKHINENRSLKEVHANSLGQTKFIPNQNASSDSKVEIDKSFKLNNLAESMQTPEWVHNSLTSATLTKSGQRDSFGNVFKPSPPLSVQVTRCLDSAITKTAALPKRRLELSDDDVDVMFLRGVVICVAKHLSVRQVELNEIVKQLGGDFKWTYDPQVCTHIIAETLPDNFDDSSIETHPSTPSDPNRIDQISLYTDVLAAKQDRKFIVRPKWLMACLAASRRLPESEFFTRGALSDAKFDIKANNQIEPKSKVARIGSSSLLGDVNRRLELLMGVPSKHIQNDIGISSDEQKPSGTNVSHTESSSIRNEERLPVHTETWDSLDLDKANSPYPPPTNGVGQRRLRRNPRRFTCAQSNKANILNHAEHNVNYSNDEFQADSAEEILDFAQPCQSLTVRWQYKDVVPRALESDPNVSTPDSLIAQLPNNQPEVHSNGTNEVDLNNLNSPIPTTGNSNALSLYKTSNTTNPVYMVSFSGLPSDERDHYADIVTRLGGEVDNQSTLNGKTTHLIVHTPTRSEKCLICLATGKWMLHKSYLDACLRESHWIDEKPYEWGGPGTEPLLVQLSPAPPISGGGPSALAQHHRQQAVVQIRELARSARRWRLAGGKAFQNWRVIFGPGCDKESSFRRVIEAGCGQVLASNPPYPPPDEVTHSFFKSRSNSSSSTLSLPRVYGWLRIDYLCAYLTAGQEASREEYVL